MPEENNQSVDYRRNRVQRLKKIIIAVMMIAIMIPYVVCGILFLQLMTTKLNLKNTQKHVEELQDNSEKSKQSVQTQMEQLEAEIQKLKDRLEEEKENEVLPESEAKHKVYLTFDDGPSSNTDEILDVLAQYNVKATFFVVGKEDDTSIQRMKRIVEQGHTLGMHSYSHKYSELYESVDSFTQDLEKIKGLVEGVTGTTCFAYRFPGGSSNTVSGTDMQEFIRVLQDENVTYYDWNISSGDAKNPVPEVNVLVDNSLKDIEKWENCVILLHDTANKHRTVEALPEIIEKIQAMEDTQILPITEQSNPVQHVRPE